jgi:mRNA-degrading endonuclease RelE of RelBE toxin-antitoxin system
MNFAPTMAYRVEFTERAIRDLKRLYKAINAEDSVQARDWCDSLEHAIFSLEEHPVRAATIPEDNTLRHLLYGRKRNIYRIIFAIDEDGKIVSVLHICHGARTAYCPDPQ